jgi:16S rRNA (uracil1498-N3)-methyltransferase
MNMPRLFCPMPLQIHEELELTAQAAKHVQVLRLQPTQSLTLFNGEGGQYEAEILKMGKQAVSVRILKHVSIERETPRRVQLLVGMPANERMDWLVEKATELGVARLTPIMTQHSVLRLSGERAQKKTAHWNSIAQAACEQCGRNTLPQIDVPQSLQSAVASLSDITQAERWVLSTRPEHQSQRVQSEKSKEQCKPWVQILSGPEGGLHSEEIDLALQAGFQALSLGPRILRAETAALTGLMLATLQEASMP